MRLALALAFALVAGLCTPAAAGGPGPGAGPGPGPQPGGRIARQPRLTRGTRASGYQRDRQGKDETADVAPHEQAAYHVWRDHAIHDLELGSGQHVPVAVVEVGPAGADKPTIVHLHGADVQLENVLLWRMARAAEAASQPVRIIAPRHHEADQVIDELTQGGGQVAVMGHSQGSRMASWAARRHAGRVTHYIGIGEAHAGSPDGETLLFSGTNGRGEHEAARGLAAREAHVTSMVFEGVDHTMRVAPARLAGGPDKGRHNASRETARVAHAVMKTTIDFVNRAPGGFAARIQRSWQGHSAEIK